PGMAYACMSETMMLALEGRYENFTLGKDVSAAQVDEINRLAQKHGFHLAGFRSFEKAVDEALIVQILQNASDAREHPSDTEDTGKDEIRPAVSGTPSTAGGKAARQTRTAPIKRGSEA